MSAPLTAAGSVTLSGKPGDSLAGWTVGFVQAQWIETNWGMYRGAAQSDGSPFLQRARAPARPRQARFDSLGHGSPFYGLASTPPQPAGVGGAPLPVVVSSPGHPSFPSTVAVGHYDSLADTFDRRRVDGVTGRTNELREAQLEFEFCAALVARSPVGRLRILRAFYWNTNWQTRFVKMVGGLVAQAIPGGNGCNVGAVFEGDPDDRRFRSIFRHPPTANCNDVFQAATLNPNIREARGWHRFDVRR